MTTPNLPANLSDLTEQELIALTGQHFEDYSSIGLPELRVNYEDVDKDGNELPRGQFKLYKDGKVYFAKTVPVRIYFITNQYRHWSQEDKKMVSVSTHFRSFSEEIPDTAGGFKCGKVSKETLESLSDAEKQEQREIKCTKVIFGTVTIGDLTDEPFVMYLKGANYMPTAEYIEELDKNGKLVFLVTTELSTEIQRNEGVTYWVVNFKALDTKHKIEKSDYDLLKSFASTVAAENNEVVEQWKQKRSKGSSGPLPFELDEDLLELEAS